MTKAPMTHTDLITRLRAKQCIKGTDRLMDEAADALTAAQKRIEELCAENERLREALAGMIKYGHETRGIRVLEAFNKAKEALQRKEGNE